jgi:DNA-binding NarL/FixJ family response regulator
VLVFGGFLSRKKNIMHNKLTYREKEVGSCLIGGMSAKETSRKLGIEVCTVEAHQRSIKKRLNGKNTYQTGYLLGKELAILA